MTDYVTCDRCGTSVEVPRQVADPVDERTAFESWAEAHYHPTHQNNGQYVNRFTRAAWKAWQARAPRTAQQVAADATAVRRKHKELAPSLRRIIQHANH